MRLSHALFIVAILATSPALPQDKAPDWVRVTENAGWQARDSQGDRKSVV